MKQPGERDHSDDTLRTTPSIRRKGRVIGRIVVNCLKLFRACVSRKKARNDIKMTSIEQEKA